MPGFLVMSHLKWFSVYQCSVFTGMVVGQVKLFFSVDFEEKSYSCALMEWFTLSMDEPDEATGFWVVEPEYDLQKGW